MIGGGHQPPRAAAPRLRASGADRALGGVFVESDAGRCLVVDRTHRPSHYHGEIRLDTVTDASASFAVITRLLGGACPPVVAPESLLFVDLETTGLAGGAGTHAFLVGFGWFEGDAFHTRQLFLDGFEHERVLLDLTADHLQGAAVIASFNGKTFDLPLIETRYLFHRRTPPSAGKPHLDLLHPSRRLWRNPDGCSLAVLERDLFGVSREDDVPGFEIPQRYFAYVRGGDAQALEPVLAHNRSDLLSLGLIALHVARLLERGAPAAGSGDECLGLGQLYEGLGEATRAIACYERAAEIRWRMPLRRVEALRAAARLYRRGRRHEDARSAWEAVIDAGVEPGMIVEAVTALAVHHEHRTRDLCAARRLATRALDAPSRTRRAAAEYRLARIDRKLQQSAQPSLTFAARGSRDSGLDPV